MPEEQGDASTRHDHLHIFVSCSAAYLRAMTRAHKFRMKLQSVSGPGPASKQMCLILLLGTNQYSTVQRRSRKRTAPRGAAANPADVSAGTVDVRRSQTRETQAHKRRAEDPQVRWYLSIAWLMRTGAFWKL
jgi:hypothetical protein